MSEIETADNFGWVGWRQVWESDRRFPVKDAGQLRMDSAAEEFLSWPEVQAYLRFPFNLKGPAMSPAALQLILLALQEAPALVALAQTELAAIRGELTPEQLAAVDAACDAAHAALQGVSAAPSVA